MKKILFAIALLAAVTMCSTANAQFRVRSFGYDNRGGSYPTYNYYNPYRTPGGRYGYNYNYSGVSRFGYNQFPSYNYNYNRGFGYNPYYRYNPYGYGFRFGFSW